MNVSQFTSHHLAKRLFTYLGSAALLLSASTWATEAGHVAVRLGTKVIGDGQSLSANSGTDTIYAANVYTYDVRANLVGEAGTPIRKLIPPYTPLSAFLESLAPGSSKFLQGTIDN